MRGYAQAPAYRTDPALRMFLVLDCVETSTAGLARFNNRSLHVLKMFQPCRGTAMKPDFERVFDQLPSCSMDYWGTPPPPTQLSQSNRNRHTYIGSRVWGFRIMGESAEVPALRKVHKVNHGITPAAKKGLAAASTAKSQSLDKRTPRERVLYGQGVYFTAEQTSGPAFELMHPPKP